ncbi:hypothetical protein WJX82_000196 [Trebouxia sp. C0006]
MAVKQPSAALHACTIRAASLEYKYEEIEDDVVLTTCESLNFGGQVEPTQAELDEYDHVLLSHQDVDDVTSGLSNLLAGYPVLADGSGFTRLLHSLALMCSNQPGLPMTFGAVNLSPPELLIGKEAFAGCDNITQEHLHQASLVLQPKTDLSSRVKLASRLLPGLCSSMAGSKCKQVLYLPAMAVQTLKAKMQLLIPSQKLSTNDVLSAVLWHVACDIRGRPRPYQPSCAGHGCLAYPLNLRSMHVPQQYCGNALLVNLLGGVQWAQIGDAKPYLFLGHSIGPQLGTAAVILQPDKSCYHVDWYIPSKLSKKLMQHKYWSSLLPDSVWL